MDNIRIVCIQIGNSDNKLSQQDWSTFVYAVNRAINSNQVERFFTGGSDPIATWQNYCFVFSIHAYQVTQLQLDLRNIADAYHQDSIAWLEGVTQFI